MTHTPYWKMALTLFILGIVLHRLFCVRTAADVLLFENRHVVKLFRGLTWTKPRDDE